MKKKIIHTLIIIGISSIVFAQKPIKKNFITEVSLKLSGTAISLLRVSNGLSTSGMIKARYFLTEKSALRFGLVANIQNDVTTVYSLISSEFETGESKIFLIHLGFQPGIERHFEGTDKLSPYIGADFGIGYGYKKEIWTNTDNGYYFIENFNRTKTTGVLTYNINLIVGTDYYFVKNVFIGIEFGWNIALIGDQGTKISYSGSEAPATNPPDIPKSNNFVWNTLAIGGIRLGFIF